MHNFNTVFQAETTAIYNAAKILNQKKTTNKMITIYTDSTSAINAKLTKKQSKASQ